MLKEFREYLFQKGKVSGAILRLKIIINFIFCFLLLSCSMPRFIILHDPLSPEEHINLGVAYERKGEFKAAIKEYEAAAKKNPLAHLYLGNVYFEMKDYERAEEYYKKAIEEDPKSSDAYNNLAWLYYTIGKDLEEAERLVLKAIELNPSKSSIYEDTLQKIRERTQNRR